MQNVLKKFMMKKFAKSEANLSCIDSEPNYQSRKDEFDKPSLTVKDCDDIEGLKMKLKGDNLEMRYQQFSRQRIVSCPETEDLKNLSKGFDSTIFDLKRICEEGMHIKQLYFLSFKALGEQFLRNDISSISNSQLDETFTDILYIQIMHKS